MTEHTSMSEAGRRARRMHVRLAGRSYVRARHLQNAGYPFTENNIYPRLTRDWTRDDLETCRAIATLLCDKIRRNERAGNRGRADLLRGFLAGELATYKRLRMQALFGMAAE